MGPDITEAYTYLNVLKLLGMKFNISASLCRIMINLISKKFKEHLLFLQVNLLLTVGLFISFFFFPL